jgi:hypothetical protein
MNARLVTTRLGLIDVEFDVKSGITMTMKSQMLKGILRQHQAIYKEIKVKN